MSTVGILNRYFDLFSKKRNPRFAMNRVRRGGELGGITGGLSPITKRGGLAE